MSKWALGFNLAVLVFNIFIAVYCTRNSKPKRKLIKPKFKVGQSVWVIDNDMIYPLCIYQITCLMNPKNVAIAYYFEKSGFAPAPQNQVFATRKKAEKALTKQRGAK